MMAGAFAIVETGYRQGGIDTCSCLFRKTQIIPKETPTNPTVHYAVKDPASERGMTVVFYCRDVRACRGRTEKGKGREPESEGLYKCEGQPGYDEEVDGKENESETDRMTSRTIEMFETDLETDAGHGDGQQNGAQRLK